MRPCHFWYQGRINLHMQHYSSFSPFSFDNGLSECFNWYRAQFWSATRNVFTVGVLCLIGVGGIILQTTFSTQLSIGSMVFIFW